jgi:hypothetical protein
MTAFFFFLFFFFFQREAALRADFARLREQVRGDAGLSA